MKTPRLPFIVIGLSLILCGVGYRACILSKLTPSSQKETRTYQPEYSVTNELALIAASDPLQDAARAMASNDFRFVAISGSYAPRIPGVSPQEKSLNTNEIRWVEGTGQIYTRTYRQAQEYAAAYNRCIADRVRSNSGGAHPHH